MKPTKKQKYKSTDANKQGLKQKQSKRARQMRRHNWTISTETNDKIKDISALSKIWQQQKEKQHDIV